MLVKTRIFAVLFVYINKMNMTDTNLNIIVNPYETFAIFLEFHKKKTKDEIFNWVGELTLRILFKYMCRHKNSSH